MPDNKQSDPQIKFRYPCTSCGGDARVGYIAGKVPGEDWNGKVAKGERICLKCGTARGIGFFINLDPQILLGNKPKEPVQ